ncbi:MAG: hypothetical protein ISS35_02765 [Kiritimatiellae bacterium]|nr:hypothetical protein [Kiritimatiellia bacterium]
MKFLPKEAWRYTVLLLILFCIAGIAVWHVMDFMSERLPSADASLAALLVWSLTLGFMFLAGAFGLWAIQFSSEAESRRRIGRLVDAMDYLSDGLLAIDTKGRIKGFNPATEAFSLKPAQKNTHLSDAFPCLKTQDVETLASSRKPQEIERNQLRSSGMRALRFRSQPSEGLTILLVSDITAMNEQRRRKRQAAQLQLVGDLARGVAHDFDNLLCSISAHASLLKRVPPGSQNATNSLESIQEASRRGVKLAGHLLEISHTPVGVYGTEAVEGHVTNALETLRETLGERWQIQHQVNGTIRPIAFSGIQIEELTLNLCLRISERLPQPGVIGVCITGPAKDGNATNEAGRIMIACALEESGLIYKCDGAECSDEDRGVIVSVIRSLLEESGGALKCHAGKNGSATYCLSLPAGGGTSTDTSQVPAELKAYVAPWSILYAAEHRDSIPLYSQLQQLGVQIKRVKDITTLLTGIEDTPRIDAMILHEHMLGAEPESLIRAVLKIRPSAGIVIISNDPDSAPSALAASTVFLKRNTPLASSLLRIIDAKTLAVKRLRNTES